jgi:DNA-binding XRE family transcriptional regulator
MILKNIHTDMSSTLDIYFPNLWNGNMITIDQIRAGRAMARLTQAQLAAQAGISTTAMNNIEHGADAKGSTLRAIQLALEKAGIEFDTDGQGVRLNPVRAKAREQ